MPLPPYLYTYDPVGTSVANKRTNELHNVAPPNDPLNANFIVPRAAPFFKVGLIVRTGAANNAPVLVEGVDYILTHPFIEASLVLNKLIYGSIMFLDRQYSGDVYLTYQTLGGGYTLDDYDIVESLTNSLYNIRLVSWTQIEGLPVSYPGLPHTHNDYEDMVGLTEVVAKLVQMVAAINTGGSNVNTLMTSFQQHLNAVMSHSKSQVGLSLVPNYPPATQDDLDTRSNTALMTPYMTLKMLVMYGSASAVDGSGLSDDAKADKVTTITGGGLATGGGTLESNRVITVPKAQLADVAAGTSDAKALTPSSGVHLIHNWANVAITPLDDVLADILDIDLVIRPGRYLLPRAMVIHTVNTGKLPIAMINQGIVLPDDHYGALLEVFNVYNDTNDRIGLIQRITHTPFFEFDNQVWERRKIVATTGGVWRPWHTVSAHREIMASCDYSANDNLIQITNGFNIASNPVPAIAPTGGYQRSTTGTTFAGNYNADIPPLNCVYTVNFVEPMLVDDYVVLATISPFAIAGLDGVHQFVIIDRQLDSFSFGVAGLSSYSNGSAVAMQRKFKLNMAFLSNRTLTRV